MLGVKNRLIRAFIQTKKTMEFSPAARTDIAAFLHAIGADGCGVDYEDSLDATTACDFRLMFNSAPDFEQSELQIVRLGIEAQLPEIMPPLSVFMGVPLASRDGFTVFDGSVAFWKPARYEQLAASVGSERTFFRYLI